MFVVFLSRYILVHHGFGLVIKGSSNLNFFNILYWLLNTFLVLFIFLSMPLAKVFLRTITIFSDDNPDN